MIDVKAFKKEYRKNLITVRKNVKPFSYVQKMFKCQAGEHKEYYKDFECSFAAECIRDIKPQRIVDIGSYRQFLLGLLAHYEITSVDVRERRACLANETLMTCDAKQMFLKSNSFDLVLSLSSIEHFGLGRYGDDFDLEADTKAIAEIKRILKPGGHIVFTIPITRGEPFIAFNAHRVYNYAMITSFFQDLELVKGRYYSHELNNSGVPYQITDKKNKWDIYMGCFKK